MTTLLYDGEVLACDSMLQFNDIKVYGDKVTKLSQGRILGVSGEIDCMPLIADCIERRASPNEYPKGEYGAILLTREDAYTVSDGVWSRISAPYACGTGGMVAIAGLLMGLDARKSVELACKVDVNSGGPVKTYRKPRKK